jgi:hypothetical protein
MSDDEDIILPKKSKQVHYGSLEEQEKARLAALAAAAREGAEDSGGKELGDIQVSNGIITIKFSYFSVPCLQFRDIYIHVTYIPLTLYSRRGSRDISNIPLRHPCFTKIS